MMVYEREVTRADMEVSLDISSWTRGIYYFRLVYNKQTVAGEKVVVQQITG
jgi:hypothetical protein